MGKLLIICGPTASGKTDLAIECAKLLNTEIISADSLYIYKDLNIGTAKPTFEERQGVAHHVIDVVESDENFTVSDYKSIVEPIIYKLQEQNKIPIVCGGTGFYINSLLFDLSYGKGEGNLEVREKYNNLAKEFGNQYVFDILKQVDVETAKKLHPNDLKRVIRALEIYESGVKKSEIIDDFKPKHDYKAFSINYPREELYQRINKRVDIMLQNGLIDEVKGLVDRGITLDNQSMQGIGYREIYSYLMGEISLDDAKELIKLNTRHYAKRQITFFKKLENHYVLTPDNAKNLAKEIVKNYDWY